MSKSDLHKESPHKSPPEAKELRQSRLHQEEPLHKVLGEMKQ